MLRPDSESAVDEAVGGLSTQSRGANADPGTFRATVKTTTPMTARRITHFRPMASHRVPSTSLSTSKKKGNANRSALYLTASLRSPERTARMARCAPHPGQYPPVRAWTGHLGHQPCGRARRPSTPAAPRAQLPNGLGRLPRERLGERSTIGVGRLACPDQNPVDNRPDPTPTESEQLPDAGPGLS